MGEAFVRDAADPTLFGGGDGGPGAQAMGRADASHTIYLPNNPVASDAAPTVYYIFSPPELVPYHTE